MKMKKFIKKLGSKVGHKHPILWISTLYFIRFKKFLNWKKPKTLNEKILFLSLKTDTSKWTNLSDKYKVREYVKDIIGEEHLVQLYQVNENINDIDFSSLPQKFVIKTNHGSGDIIIVKNKENLDFSNIKKQIQNNLKPFYGNGGEKHYEKIKPLILFEELLENDLESKKYSTSIIDYKFWCFNGKCQYIWVCSNRDKNGAEVLLYDTNWNSLPQYSIFNNHYRRGKVIPKPSNLELMIHVAEKLAKPFPCVRVDLYNINNRIYFGEMTFTSLGGLMNFYTNEFLEKAGSMIDLNYNGNEP